ncbi:MAG: DUF1638 domain-containing protein [Coriobacteriales bacterium]|jgi:hypothetical protein|nr:DUF1638 domain-containing protein [Coriobacteriales bacterium]
MLHLKVLACKALFRELSMFATYSPNVIDFTWLPWGLHDLVGELVVALQEEIDAIDSGKDRHSSYPPYNRPFDAILLGYGLCSNGIAGLSSKTCPLVIPRAHDCITLFLGSKERYRELFDENGGTYWYSAGWIENSELPGKREHAAMVERLSKKHDEESAEMMTSLYEEWQTNYSRLAQITWPEFAGKEFQRDHCGISTDSAEELGWQFAEFEGDSTLLSDFIAGNWDDGRFLVVPPGKKVEPSYGDDIITYTD